MNSSTNLWNIFIGFSGLSAIALGAAGAHAVPDAAASAIISKASFYQLIHTLALMHLVSLQGKIPATTRAAFTLGIILFCGSLYAKGFGIIAAAPLAPAGGMLLMLGWCVFAAMGYQKTKKQP